MRVRKDAGREGQSVHSSPAVSEWRKLGVTDLLSVINISLRYVSISISMDNTASKLRVDVRNISNMMGFG